MSAMPNTDVGFENPGVFLYIKTLFELPSETCLRYKENKSDNESVVHLHLFGLNELTVLKRTKFKHCYFLLIGSTSGNLALFRHVS